MTADALKRLIAEVEAGTLTGGDGAIAVPLDKSDLIVAGIGDHERWSECVAAHDGSIDAAMSLHKALLPGLLWSFTPRGRCRILNDHFNEISESGYDHGPARSWLLAILRAKLAEANIQEATMTDKYGKPTAMKVRGTEFYVPAVTTPYGTKKLPYGDRKDTRYAATKEAERVLAKAYQHE